MFIQIKKISVLIVAILLLCSCTRDINNESSVNSGEEDYSGSQSQNYLSSQGNNPSSNQPVVYPDNQTDDEILAKYCVNLDLCLIGDYELVFNDSSEISANCLWMFFQYITGHENLYDIQKYYNKENGLFYIPTDLIQKTVEKYFVNLPKIDFGKIYNVIYDQFNEEEQIITKDYGGFGGARFEKFIKKEKVNENVYKFTVDYYESEEKIKVSYRKIYTIKIDDQGYQYISIEKIVK